MASPPTETDQKAPKDRAQHAADHIKNDKDHGATQELHKDIRDMQNKSPQERADFYKNLQHDTSDGILPKGFSIAGTEEGGNIQVKEKGHVVYDQKKEDAAIAR